MKAKHKSTFCIAITVFGCALILAACTGTSNDSITPSSSVPSSSNSSLSDLTVGGAEFTKEAFDAHLEDFYERSVASGCAVVDTALTKLFPKQVCVFGIAVLATEATPDDKHMLAARALAEFIDADEDGVADDPARVIEVCGGETCSPGHFMMFAGPDERKLLDTKIQELRRYPSIGELIADDMTDLQGQLNEQVLDLFGERFPGGAADGNYDSPGFPGRFSTLSYTSQQKDSSPFQIHPGDYRFKDSLWQGMTEPFPKHTDVFGIPVFGTERVSERAVLHAAIILAELLDNNEDGVPDNQKVVGHLVSSYKYAVVFYDWPAVENYFRHERTDASEEIEKRGGSLFSMMEVGARYAGDPSPESGGCVDQHLEELYHLVAHGGYAEVYPDVFGGGPGSVLAELTDNARGGYFEEIPNEYPSNAWYTNPTESCQYAGCQDQEYLHWAQYSLLGFNIDRVADVASQWKLATPELLRKYDPGIVRLLTDPEYALPKVLPDFSYHPKK